MNDREQQNENVEQENSSIVQNEDTITDENDDLIDYKEDFFLQWLVFTAESTGFGYPVTLNVKGTLITGFVTSKKKFRDNLLTQMKNALKQLPEDQGEIMIKNHISPVENILNEDKNNELPELTEIKYIHLDKAQIYSPGAKPIPGKSDGIFWRGRLDSIDGFFFGKLEPNIVN